MTSLILIAMAIAGLSLHESRKTAKLLKTISLTPGPRGEVGPKGEQGEE